MRVELVMVMVIDVGCAMMTWLPRCAAIDAAKIQGSSGPALFHRAPCDVHFRGGFSFSVSHLKRLSALPLSDSHLTLRSGHRMVGFQIYLH